MVRPAGLFFAILLALLFLLPAPCLAADQAAEPAPNSAAKAAPKAALDPDMDEGHRQFAHANYEEALGHYLKALERNKEDAYLYFRLGLTYYMLDDMDNSRNYWNESIDIDPRVGDTLVTTIKTDYMEPTLLKGDITITDDKYYSYFKHGHGDVIDYYTLNSNSTSISRIVGLPGDMIEIKDNTVHRSNVYTKKSFIEKVNKILSLSNKKFVVPNDCHYVLDDKKNSSIEKEHLKCVKNKDIIGKVFAILGSKETIDGKTKPREERFGLAIK
jgi:signal peptidase I